ncbi:glycosyltransferase [Arthrobacter yangruifuii]|uniref:glycosyltransferase n=1 Tax=Arthrobacter yangruifuii TaxID=2606616 RepID=UPI001648C719|nr:glycosyltransferase [Arthrobacter yangruifuii]
MLVFIAAIFICGGLAILIGTGKGLEEALISIAFIGGVVSLLSASSLAAYRRTQTWNRSYVRQQVDAVLQQAARNAEDAKAALDIELATSVKRIRNEQKRLIDASEARVLDEVTMLQNQMFTPGRKADAEGTMAKFVDEIRESMLHQVFKLARDVGSCSGLFSRDDLKILSKRFDEYDSLTIHWLLSTYAAFDVLPLTPRRKLSTDLRSIGYLSKSLEVLESVAELTGTARDRLVLDARRSEMNVYNGEYEPILAGKSETVETIPSTVLHIVARALPSVQSGYTLRTHYSATAQLEDGLSVAVVSQVGEAPSTADRESVNIDGVVYYTLPGQPKNLVRWEEWLDTNITELVSVVREVRPAVIHAHSDFFNAISAQAVGDYFGIPVVYESRGFWEESWLSRTSQRFGLNWDALEMRWGLPEAYQLRKAREEEARAQAERVFTLARVMKGRIEEAGVARENIALVPNAVRSSDFPVLARDAALAHEFGLSDQCLTIGYVSSIVEYEGIDTLLEGFRLAAASVDQPVRLLIVGDGPALPALREQAHTSGIRDVTFTGRVAHSDVLRFYSLIDIFVVPRRPVAVCHLVTPLKPFEAFSTGRTVVMSDVKALREIAEDSGAVELFAAGNALSLAEVLIRLAEDPDRRALLAERGAAWVRIERSWKRNSEEYLRVYDQLGVLSKEH